MKLERIEKMKIIILRCSWNLMDVLNEGARVQRCEELDIPNIVTIFVPPAVYSESMNRTVTYEGRIFFGRYIYFVLFASKIVTSKLWPGYSYISSYLT